MAIGAFFFSISGLLIKYGTKYRKIPSGQIAFSRTFIQAIISGFVTKCYQRHSLFGDSPRLKKLIVSTCTISRNF